MSLPAGVEKGDPVSWGASLVEPCDVTVHLPSGKFLKVRTRPILFISRLIARNDDGDVVTEVVAPPEEGAPGPLSAKARYADKLLREWGAKPTPHMRASLDELMASPTTQIAPADRGLPAHEGARGKGDKDIY